MSVVDLAVVGLGLASPTGLRPADHAFFVRAGQTLAGPQVFVRDDGDRVDATHCAWLGAEMPLPARIRALALRAIASALEPLREQPWMRGKRIAAQLVGPASWQAYSDADATAMAASLGQALPLRLGATIPGEAGCFQALEVAHQWIQAGEQAVLVAAADSAIGVDALAARAAQPRRWESSRAPLAEAAAAFVVMAPTQAAAASLDVLGTLQFAGVERGVGTDSDDDIVDGAAMTQLLREASALGPFRFTFGQHNVDSLRQRAFDYAMSRNAQAMGASARTICVEDDIGRVGAAAGAVHLAYALAAHNHRTVPADDGDAFVAWAISRDGVRGLCAGRGPSRD